MFWQFLGFYKRLRPSGIRDQSGETGQLEIHFEDIFNEVSLIICWYNLVYFKIPKQSICQSFKLDQLILNLIS